MARRGRPPKPRESILTAEQIAEIQSKGLTPAQLEAAERRRKDAERKRLERQKAKAEKEVESIESYEQLWEMNRSTIPESEMNVLLARQERVWDLVQWMNDVVNGTLPPTDDELYVSMVEGTADVYVHVAEHGTTAIEVVLLDQFWLAPIYKEKFHGTDATSIFARLGIVTGIPSHKLHAFEQHVATQNATRNATPPIGNGFVTMMCGCGRIDGQESTPISIVEEYRVKNIKFLCYRCRDIERKSQMQSTLYSK